MCYSLAHITVPASAIRPAHEPGFEIDYPFGRRLYCVVLFHSPVVLRDRHGLSERPPGTWIVYRPTEPLYYRSPKGALSHTWIIAMGPGVDRCLREYSIPTNLAFEFGGLEFLESCIKLVRQEQSELKPFYKDAITELLWEFFLRAGVLIHDVGAQKTANHSQKTELLRQVREQVLTHILRRWTVQDMAALVGMKPTSFAISYRSEFGTSPIDDLIEARVRHAESMLRDRAQTIKQISFECGFSSFEHFDRVFRRRRGCSPGRYTQL